MMSVTVEFFGIPRQRTGIAQTTADAGTLGSVLAQLAQRYPRFAESCLHAGALGRGYTANLNGRRFVADLQTPLNPGDAILILSADAGG
jgi:molybdopterin converting factor small subunit